MEADVRQDDGGYQGPPEHRRELCKTEEGYELKTHDQRKYHFNTKGKLTTMTDISGNAVGRQYEEDLLSRVKSAGGALDFAYGKDGPAGDYGSYRAHSGLFWSRFTLQLQAKL